MELFKIKRKGIMKNLLSDNSSKESKDFKYYLERRKIINEYAEKGTNNDKEFAFNLCMAYCEREKHSTDPEVLEYKNNIANIANELKQKLEKNQLKLKPAESNRSLESMKSLESIKLFEPIRSIESIENLHDQSDTQLESTNELNEQLETDQQINLINKFVKQNIIHLINDLRFSFSNSKFIISIVSILSFILLLIFYPTNSNSLVVIDEQTDLPNIASKTKYCPIEENEQYLNLPKKILINHLINKNIFCYYPKIKIYQNYFLILDTLTTYSLYEDKIFLSKHWLSRKLFKSIVSIYSNRQSFDSLNSINRTNFHWISRLDKNVDNPIWFFIAMILVLIGFSSFFVLYKKNENVKTKAKNSSKKQISTQAQRIDSNDDYLLSKKQSRIASFERQMKRNLENSSTDDSLLIIKKLEQNRTKAELKLAKLNCRNKIEELKKETKSADLASMFECLAFIYFYQKKFDYVIKNLKEALNLRESKTPDISLYGMIRKVYLIQNDYKSAIKITIVLKQKLKSNYGKNHPLIVQELINLFHFRLKENNYNHDELRKLIEEANEILKKIIQIDKENKNWIKIMKLIIKCHLDQTKFSCSQNCNKFYP